MKYIIQFILIISFLPQKAYSQISQDSLESKVRNLKFGFYFVMASGPQIPPLGNFVYCYISCEDRKLFEKVSTRDWMALMRKDSLLGLNTTALLYDLYKEEGTYFKLYEYNDLVRWTRIGWKVEMKLWKKYLRKHSYKYKEKECFILE